MYDRRLAFVAACLGMAVFGIVLTLLGSILPSLIERFEASRAEAGSLLSLLSLGILAGSVVFGPVADRFGYRALLVACTTGILAGIEGIAFAPSFGWLLIAVFVVGLGGGVLNGATNALVADVREEGRGAGLSLLGVFFGIGAFGVPFTLGFLVETFSYTALVAGVGTLVIAPLVFAAAIRFPEPKQAQGFPLRDGLALFKDPVLLLFGLMLFLQSGMEITSSGWATSYVDEVLTLGAGEALFFLSLFWLGMILARLLLTVLLERLPQKNVLLSSFGVALAGSVLLLVAGDAWLATPGIFLLGAGLAAGFPVVLGCVGDRHPDLSGTAFGIVLVMALTGGSLLPFVAGVIGEELGLRASFGVLPVALVLTTALFFLALRRMSPR